MEAKEITLSELLSTDFIIVDNKMLGTFTLDRINMISDVLNQQKRRIDKAIEYIENLQQSNEELQRDYNKSIDFGIYETDNLLSILKGDTNE